MDDRRHRFGRNDFVHGLGILSAAMSMFAFVVAWMLGMAVVLLEGESVQLVETTWYLFATALVLGFVAMFCIVGSES